MTNLEKIGQYAASFARSDVCKFVMISAAFLLISSNPSMAQDFNGVTKFLDAVVKAITGPIGIAISSLAVMAIGFSFMTGRMDWTFAVAIVLGIAIVFGGASFVKGLTAA